MHQKKKRPRKEGTKMSQSMQFLRKGVERLLSSGKYLIRGDFEGRINLGEAGGTWATNDIDNALIYGDQISVVPRPKKIFQSEIDDACKMRRLTFEKEYILTKQFHRMGKVTGWVVERRV
jgi:hypothetical protein